MFIHGKVIGWMILCQIIPFFCFGSCFGGLFPTQKKSKTVRPFCFCSFLERPTKMLGEMWRGFKNCSTWVWHPPHKIPVQHLGWHVTSNILVTFLLEDPCELGDATQSSSLNTSFHNGKIYCTETCVTELGYSGMVVVKKEVAPIQPLFNHDS